jgi:chromosome segregation ATPase
MDRAQIDHIRSMAGFFRSLAEIPPILERIETAEQSVRNAESQRAKIMREIADMTAKNEAQSVAMAERELKMSEREKHAKEVAAAIEEKAISESQDLVDSAQEKAADIKADADSYAERIKHDAAVIDKSIAAKRAEVATLEKRVADAKAYLKKLKDE